MQLHKILAFLAENGVDYDFVGDDSIEINQVSGLDNARADQVSFLTDKKYLDYLQTTQAGLVILNKKMVDATHVAHLLVDNPYYVYALVAQLLNPLKPASNFIHPSAVVHQDAIVGDDVYIGENVVVQQGVKIESGSYLAAGCVIEEFTTLGKQCRIGSNATICHHCSLGDNVIIEAGAVIGGDGFGWANNQGQWFKIPQVGRVIIGNNVSIGNNVTVDRGAIEDTIIEDNCIIDNQVHLAHNVKIGSGSAIAGQAGFAGSTVLGKNCTVAGQVGFAGHIEITDNVHFLAKAGVTHDITESGAYAGFPAIKASDWQKNSVRVRQLDKLAKQVKALQKQIDILSN
ncbi:UDP-3-O-acylglucosamine N-acyltransferase [Thiomicrorhabdus immobilis]|uniref:UDP-3-O-acylglucosamine N-acyltransferase n=1 Tax=Thiomicrorhabdus immobilis TaxID=2791037 RepID=A0ABM7MDF4_9GAMM|nr:UDP-3-O-(3-hydroxymyristoyl)glucosamine N-acyltransferase [Thiomicrorhabdus immobilis]BCN93434.1 UDP-3-O-acylglucosamine N-acyltransferase [Thiomicrorhabdus immobilis]